MLRKGLEGFMPFMTALLRDPNFKIEINALQIIGDVVGIVGADIAPHGAGVMRQLIEKLGDHKTLVRQANGKVGRPPELANKTIRAAQQLPPALESHTRPWAHISPCCACPEGPHPDSEAPMPSVSRGPRTLCRPPPKMLQVIAEPLTPVCCTGYCQADEDARARPSVLRAAGELDSGPVACPRGGSEPLHARPACVRGGGA